MFQERPYPGKGRGAKRSLVCKRGINDAPYLTSYKEDGITFTCPYFFKWRQMFHRCYSPSWLKKHPTYQGCEVAPEWYSFMAFRQWMLKQQWMGKHLDKDLLSRGRKVYSPTTCLFVSPQINSIFNERDSTQGTFPLGIYKRKGKYEVGCSKGNGKRSWVGVFDNVPDAIDAYLAAKREAVDFHLAKEKDKKVVKAVNDYWMYFADKLSTLKAGY